MRHLLASTVFALLLGGCHHAATRPLPGTLVASNDPSAAGHEALPPVGPPLASVGERLQYEVSLHGVMLADLVLEVAGVTELAGREAVVVDARVDTRALASLVSPVHDRFTSWIDLKTGLPIQFDAREAASKDDRVNEQTLAQFAPGRYPVRLVRGDNAGDEAEQVVQGTPFDFVAFLVFLRGWEAREGTELTVDIMRSRYVWRVRVVVGKHGNLASALGDLQVVRFDGEGVRLRRDGSVDPTSDRRRFSIWISDDADRVPLALAAHTDYGDVKLDLINYSASGDR